VNHAGLRTNQPVTLRVNDRTAPGPFVDQETGSHWDETGRAVEGKLKGWTLDWMDSTQVKWFAWAAEYPTTSVFGTPTAMGRTI